MNFRLRGLRGRSGQQGMTLNSGRASKSVQTSVDWTGLISNIQLVLNTESACKGAFAGAMPVINYNGSAAIPVHTLAINTPSGAVPVANDTPVTNGLSVTSMQINPTTIPPLPYPDGAGGMTYKSYLTTFTVNATKSLSSGTAVGGDTKFTQSPYFNLITDATGAPALRGRCSMRG